MSKTFTKKITKTNKKITKKAVKFIKKNPDEAVAIGAATAGAAAIGLTSIVRNTASVLWCLKYKLTPLKKTPMPGDIKESTEKAATNDSTEKDENNSADQNYTQDQNAA